MHDIWELEALDYIEEISNKYEKLHGHDPQFVSDWNPSNQFKQKISKHINIKKNETTNVMDYIFSYTNSNLNELSKKLWGNGNWGKLITPSGSASINVVIHWLVQQGINNVDIICPTYFTVPNVLKRFGINCTKHYLHKESDQTFSLSSTISVKSNSALWITNPVYCTGVQHFNPFQHPNFDCDQWSTVILDQCLASDTQVFRKLHHFDNVIDIRSPHKPLCINGSKFSAIGFNSKHQNVFDHIADLVYGCLSTSNIDAVDDYLSPNFNVMENKIFNEFKNISRKFRDIVNSNIHCETDQNSIGYLRTIYTPSFQASKNNSQDILWQLTQNTGATFLTGLRNHFSPDGPFCFRVNLCRDSPLHWAALTQLVQALPTFLQK